MKNNPAAQLHLHQKMVRNVAQKANSPSPPRSPQRIRLTRQRVRMENRFGVILLALALAYLSGQFLRILLA